MYNTLRKIARMAAVTHLPRLNRKAQWEFEWQRDNWATLYSSPQVFAKVAEYWHHYRHLGEILSRVAISDRTLSLDVGCGLSTVLHYIPGKRFGIDPLAEHYKGIYNYPREITIQAAGGESIPFGDSLFDVAFCSNCIDHTTSPEATAAEIKRVLRPDGYFIVTCEVFHNDLGVRNDGHPHSLTIEKLLNLVRDFRQVEHWESPWYGLRGYVLGHEPTPQTEHILLLQKN